MTVHQSDACFCFGWPSVLLSPITCSMHLYVSSTMSNVCPDQIYLQYLTPNVPWKHTCGEHARVGVSRGETHVLLDASAGAFGHPLDRQVLRLLQYPPPFALVMNSLHSAVQWWLKRLQLGGGLPQQEARHKLTQHRWTLVLLHGGGIEINEGRESVMMWGNQRKCSFFFIFYLCCSWYDGLDYLLIFSSGDYMNCDTWQSRQQCFIGLW